MSTLNIRADFAAIAKWIAPNSQVLDLGCGDGSFLEFLQTPRYSLLCTSYRTQGFSFKEIF
jgi:2-polyprenyl-3-methyl-5-hydroxy-6-metoxy-1,4-benzoquinol methylase